MTVYALTSTESANGDQGADPNKLVTINDVLTNTNPAVGAGEQFTTIETASYGQSSARRFIHADGGSSWGNQSL